MIDISSSGLKLTANFTCLVVNKESRVGQLEEGSNVLEL